jgi:hypothetical protein
MYRRWMGWVLVALVLSVMATFRIADDKERAHRIIPGTIFHEPPAGETADPDSAEAREQR